MAISLPQSTVATACINRATSRELFKAALTSQILENKGVATLLQALLTCGEATD
jgi:hypothetical protein